MLGKRTISHARQRDKEPANSFRVHDERAHVIFGVGIGLEIRNIIPRPLASGFIEPDLFAAGIPGLAVEIAGSTVIEHAAIHWPGPAPSGMNTQTITICRIAALGVRDRVRPGTAIQPVAG